MTRPINSRWPDQPVVDQPDAPFQDDSHLYFVSITPARLPVPHWAYGALDMGTAMVGLVYVVIGAPIAKLLDSRWKVVVARLRPERFARWRTLEVEVLESQTTAESRQEQILRDWQRGAFSNAVPLSRAQVRSILDGSDREQ